MGEPRQLHLLGLHGFRTSGRILETQVQMSRLQAKLGSLIKVTYLDGPHPASGPSDEGIRRTFSEHWPKYEWWNALEPSEAEGRSHWVYDGVEGSIEYVLSKAQELGPFDGLLGFSQGTILATLLLARRQLPQHQGSDDSLGRLAVLMSGVQPRTGLKAQAPIDVPSCHLIGEQDFAKRASLKLVECYSEAQGRVVIVHPLGHVVPKLEGEDFAALQGFLQAQCHPQRGML